MRAFPYKHPAVSEANNTGAPVAQFPWTHPWNYFPAAEINLNALQANEVADVPFQSFAPMTEPAKSCELEMSPTKNKKKKASAKSSTQVMSKDLGPKRPKTKPSTSKKVKGETKPKANVERKNLNIDYGEANFDFSGVPPPFCSCTGEARTCYKWGVGGWQSSCCNSSISAYPLPMSSSRPGSRLAGRKMSQGAYGKLLFKLATEGHHDLSRPVDLKEHWSKHGTNKFVTLK